MAANFDRFGQTIDPLSPENLRKDNRSQMLADILRNTGGVPEAALTMGTSLADMAGTGLGTLAGMARSKLKGEAVDMDAAAEGMQAGKFTFMPRSEGGKELLGGLETVMAPLERGMVAAGQKAADVTGSPAVGAGVYTALSVLDPELLAPAAAKVAALRGAQNVARGAAETAVPMSEALRNVPKGQRGAYSLEDLAGTEGDFSMKSPTLGAFDKLKPQEQGRVTGTQLRSALMREGAKKEELTWMGLDDVLASVEPLSTADVRKIAEANAPEYEFASTRRGAGGELDEDAINERVSELVGDDDDLTYPVTVYQGTGRSRTELETFDTQREADRWIRDTKESYVDDNLDGETEYHLGNIDEHFDEDTLAAMTDEQKQEWAESSARSSLEESQNDIEYETENNYDNGATNIDEITEYWDNQVRANPGDYGIEGSGGSPPAYGEYTVGKKGRDAEYNYTVSAGRLAAEERFGKGGRDTPDFIEPYLRDEVADPTDPQQSLFKNIEGQNIAVPHSKAFAIEALRRKAREADPNAARYRSDVSKSHYDEFGDNQLYFSRETDRAAPVWGSVQEGVGRVEGAALKTPDGSELPQREGASYPTRLLEEAQSDWLQAGRKTGWMEPKTVAKLAADEADEAGRVKAFQEQALAELPVTLESDNFANFVQEAQQRVAEATARGETPGHWDQQVLEQMRRYEEHNIRNPAAYSTQDRLIVAQQLFGTLYNAAPSGSAVETLAQNLRRSLEHLPQMDRSPLSKTTPSAPMRETRQYTQLAMADALRRAVQEGQQYLAWTPGDVHTKRWGTDTFQYAPSPDNPRVIRYSGYDTSRDTSAGWAGTSGLENLQRTADELLGDEVLAQTIDLDDPNIDKVLEDIVENQLNYGMHEYPNPQKQRQKRAAQLRKDLEAASKAAQAGESKAAHYSPRAFGYDAAYEPLGEDLAAILRRSGVKMPEVRDIEGYGSKVRGIEIDPEIARAAKRGLTLPY